MIYEYFRVSDTALPVQDLSMILMVLIEERRVNGETTPDLKRLWSDTGNRKFVRRISSRERQL